MHPKYFMTTLKSSTKDTVIKIYYTNSDSLYEIYKISNRQSDYKNGFDEIYYPNGVVKSSTLWNHKRKLNRIDYDTVSKIFTSSYYMSVSDTDYPNTIFTITYKFDTIDNSSMYLVLSKNNQVISYGQPYCFMLYLKGHLYQKAVFRLNDFDDQFNYLNSGSNSVPFNDSLRAYVQIAKPKPGLNTIRGQIVNYDIQDSATKNRSLYFSLNFYVKNQAE